MDWPFWNLQCFIFSHHHFVKRIKAFLTNVLCLFCRKWVRKSEGQKERSSMTTSLKWRRQVWNLCIITLERKLTLYQFTWRSLKSCGTCVYHLLSCWNYKLFEDQTQRTIRKISQDSFSKSKMGTVNARIHWWPITFPKKSKINFWAILSLCMYVNVSTFEHHHMSVHVCLTTDCMVIRDAACVSQCAAEREAECCRAAGSTRVSTH